MTTRANRPMSGFHWLRLALTVGRNNPRAVMGGAMLLVGAALLPQMLQALVHVVLAPDPQTTVAVSALMTLLAIALLVPMMGGYLRLIHASEHGQPVHARDVFQLFQSRGWRSCAGFGYLLVLLQVVMGYVLITLFADGLLDWWLKSVEVMNGPRQGQAPPQLPALPEGTGGFLGVGSLFALFLSGVFSVGLGQIALSGRGVLEALADGVRGTLKNLLPLLVLAVLAFCGGLVAAFALLVYAAVVGWIGNLIHPLVTMVLFLPVYLLFVAALYAVMFGAAYRIWRDITGQEASPVAPAATPGGIEA